MAKAKFGDTVRVHYTGKLEDGTVFDTSVGESPVEFTLGQNSVIPGFEQALLGMSPGESKTEKIPSELAYGPYLDELTVEVDRNIFQAQEITPQVGLQLEVTGSDGRRVPLVVTEVSDAKVKLDGNHPLAGKTLIFDIELLEILAT